MPWVTTLPSVQGAGEAIDLSYYAPDVSFEPEFERWKELQPSLVLRIGSDPEPFRDSLGPLDIHSCVL